MYLLRYPTSLHLEIWIYPRVFGIILSLWCSITYKCNSQRKSCRRNRFRVESAWRCSALSGCQTIRPRRLLRRTLRRRWHRFRQRKRQRYRRRPKRRKPGNRPTTPTLRSWWRILRTEWFPVDREINIIIIINVGHNVPRIDREPAVRVILYSIKRSGKSKTEKDFGIIGTVESVIRWDNFK